MFDDQPALAPKGPALLPIAALPPAARVAAVFCFAVFTSLLSHPGLALIACAAPFLLAIIGGLPLRKLLRKLLPVNFFFVFLFLLLPLDFSSGALSFTRRGLELAFLITLKGNAIAAMALTLLGVSAISDICRGLLKLRLPEKLVTLLLLTYSNLFLMKEECARLFTAAKLRGFIPSTSLSGYKTTAWLLAMLLIRSWQRAQRVDKAMRLRGFSGRYPLLELPPAIPRVSYGRAFFFSIGLISVSLFSIDAFL